MSKDPLTPLHILQFSLKVKKKVLCKEWKQIVLHQQVVADYLVAERETLEREKGGKR